MSVTIEKIVSLCKRRGFVFPGSEIYGGLANTWDYGPLGAQMKMNIKQDWWKRVVESRDDMVGLDGSILMNPRVWEASGHVANFSDPMVEDTVTHKRYRADHLIENKLDISADGKSTEELQKIIEENNILSPDGNPLSAPRTFNLMFETNIGVVEGEKSSVYLRPETAQAIFVNFKNVLETSRKRLPFGIAQIGKAFRNEITPGNFTFRTLEFEQMEIEYFIEEREWEEQFNYWLDWQKSWAESLGLDMKRLHTDEHSKEALSHYSKRTVDYVFDFPFGEKKELWGLAYRTDFDLRNHTEHSGEKLEYPDPEDNKKKIVPHVIEPTMGVDRTLLAILVSAYTEEEVEGDTRVVMKFKPHIAPYQVAVLPLMKKDPLGPKAREVFESLQEHFRAEFDVTGSIGKRYRRQDEIGTPYCVTIDHDTLEDGTVTVRDRDSMEQERVKIGELVGYLGDKIMKHEA